MERTVAKHVKDLVKETRENAMIKDIVFHSHLNQLAIQGFHAMERNVEKHVLYVERKTQENAMIKAIACPSHLNQLVVS